MTIRDWTDYIWPTLAPFSDAEKAEIALEEKDEIAAIASANWSVDTDVAIEEARRYFDSEEERLDSAKVKATNFMLFLGAFVPLLTYFAAAIWDKKTWSAPVIPSAVVFIAACLYLLGAGYWSFRALRVNTFHRVDASDLSRVWGTRKPKEALVKEIMTSTRANRRPVNEIVSCIKMAHSFLRLAFIWLGVLLVLEVGVNLFQLHPVAEPAVPQAPDPKTSKACDQAPTPPWANVILAPPGQCLQPLGAAPYTASELLGRAKP